SAIGTVAPVIDAQEKDKGLSITIVNVTGTLLMVTLPVLSAILYTHETVQTSALIGGTVQSIGQVIASAKLVNDDVANLSIVFKLMRVLLIIGVALVFGKMNFEKDKPLFSKSTSQHEKTKNSAGVPWFIIGFFCLFLLRSFISLPDYMITSAQGISNQFEIAALAAIGLRVKFSDIVKEGPKTLLYGLLVGTTQILVAVTLIFWLF
ncbi:MAG: putative sulfate exporter family transporter, partial [Carnobacterium sp.]|nr:putative sulfate exporter family transporter [Carnobacterium sp.]